MKVNYFAVAAGSFVLIAIYTLIMHEGMLHLLFLWFLAFLISVMLIDMDIIWNR